MRLALYDLFVFIYSIAFTDSVRLDTNRTELKNENSFEEFSAEDSLEKPTPNVWNSPNMSMILKMATPCETPNFDPGYCIEIKLCTTLLTQLNNTKARDFLRASMCGPDSEDPANPKVCCGRYNKFRKSASKGKTKVETHAQKELFPRECGRQKFITRGRIVGGVEAALGEFPWMARLIYRNRYGYKSFGCCGFLIHPKFILTAAHCIESNRSLLVGPIYSVVLGEHDTRTKIDCTPGGKICADHPQTSRVAKAIAHPGFNLTQSGYYNDIGLIYLKKKIQITDFIKPICLLTDSSEVTSRYTVSGWGKSETDQLHPVKLKTHLEAVDRKSCQEVWSAFNIHIKHTQLCAGGNTPSDTCGGDSGGPLMLSSNGTVWFAAGIVSYGLGCAINGWPGVYTNIPNYITWIEEQMQQTIIDNKTNKRRLKGKRIQKRN